MNIQLAKLAIGIAIPLALVGTGVAVAATTDPTVTDPSAVTTTDPAATTDPTVDPTATADPTVDPTPTPTATGVLVCGDNDEDDFIIDDGTLTCADDEAGQSHERHRATPATPAVPAHKSADGKHHRAIPAIPPAHHHEDDDDDVTTPTTAPTPAPVVTP